VLTIERAVDRVLSFRAAAYWTNFTLNAGTVPAGAPLSAQFTRGIHGWTSLSYHREMARTDLYIKVELDLDEKEKPERVASEICRLIRKQYGVRSAEVSSMVEKD
jgi:hypothetical protein